MYIKTTGSENKDNKGFAKYFMQACAGQGKDFQDSTQSCRSEISQCGSAI